MHLPTGKLLMWSGSGGASRADQYLWDIEENTFEHVPAIISQRTCTFPDSNKFVDCETDADCAAYCDDVCPTGDSDDESCEFNGCAGLDEALSCDLDSEASPDLFCAGHTLWVEGDPIIQGGNVTGGFGGLGPRSVYRFIEEAWELVGLMSIHRWYPTLTTLRDSKIAVYGGLPGDKSITVIKEGVLGPSQSDHPVDGGSITYPFMFPMKDGRIFYAGCENPGNEDLFDGMIFDPETMAWEDEAFLSNIPGGSAVMYEPDKIMKSGGCAGGSNGRCEAFDGTQMIDLGDDDPVWSAACPMPQKRHFHTLTQLPDGSVLMTGGNTEGNGSFSSFCREPDGDFSFDECETTEECCDGVADSSGGDCERTCESYDNSHYATRSAALWWPWSGHWFELGEQEHYRMYHSTAMLLPDGRVLSAGSAQTNNVPDVSEVEFFSPPYKFWGDAPRVVTAPSEADFGSTVNVRVAISGVSKPARKIERVTMLRLGSVTHQFDQDQRFVELDFSVRNQWNLNVTMPDGEDMIPGWTMLFVLADGEDIPQEFKDLAAVSDAPTPAIPSEGHYLKLNVE